MEKCFKMIYKGKKEIPRMCVCNTVPVLKFPLLDKISNVEHLFTTRLGGASKGCFSSMNISFTRGDETEAVLQNYERIAKIFGVEAKDVVCSHQTHTTNVLRVTKEDAGKGVVRKRDYENIDGLITDEKNLVLCTMYADCVPLYFVDAKNNAIGLSHSGWKGTKERMGKVTLERMKEEFGTEPKDVYVVIGPSICQDCYEVSEDVILEFKKNFSDNEMKQICYAKGNHKYQLDLWKANELVLLEAGILREHLEITNLCTHCNSELLFSHRKMGDMRGNLGAFLCIK